MDSQQKERRLSERLLVRVPVVLKGVDASGRAFFDRTEVLSVDQRGGRIRTRFQLSVGKEVEVQLPSENSSKRLRVVWCGEPKSVYEGVAGVEFVDPKETWNFGALQAQSNAPGL